MTENERLAKVLKDGADKKVADKVSKDAIVKKYADKKKVKPLTIEERIARMEELLGIVG